MQLMNSEIPISLWIQASLAAQPVEQRVGHQSDSSASGIFPNEQIPWLLETSLRATTLKRRAICPPQSPCDVTRLCSFVPTLSVEQGMYQKALTRSRLSHLSEFTNKEHHKRGPAGEKIVRADAKKSHGPHGFLNTPNSRLSALDAFALNPVCSP